MFYGKPGKPGKPGGSTFNSGEGINSALDRSSKMNFLKDELLVSANGICRALRVAK